MVGSLHGGQAERLPGVSERTFRTGTVIPFLDTLKNTAYFPIQQVALIGHPDFMLCINGRFCGLELKKDGEKPRPIQQWLLDRITDCKGVALVACPSNWDEVKRYLKELDEGDSDGTG